MMLTLLFLFAASVICSNVPAAHHTSASVIQDRAHGLRAAAATSSTTSTLTLAPSGTVPTGYVQTSGSSFVVDGQAINLRGVNLGGWLVIEDWMDGIADDTDDSGAHPYRQSFETLSNRFGTANATTLTNTWEANFLDAADFSNIANVLNFNLVRIPFSYTTLQNADGSWRSDAFTRLDWVVAQAQQNGLYVVLVFHIWNGQFADYSTISENTNAGENQRQLAEQIWIKVSQHYLNNPTIAAFDVINEPTGSYANYLQRNLYSAVRSVDPYRIVVLESFSAAPSKYNFHQIVYSFHEYKMEGSDFDANKAVWQSNKTTIQQYQAFPAPFYMGELTATDNQTLQYLLSEMNSIGVAWSMWTYKAVDMNGWAFYNYPHYPVTFRVDINTDSYEHILGVWQNMSSTNATLNTELQALYQGYGV